MAKAKLANHADLIISRFKELDESRTDLKQRWRDDYSDWRMDEWHTSKTEGSYDDYTDNGMAVLGNKSIEAISQGQVQVKIQITDETLLEREELSNTENACIGLFNILDDNFAKIEQPPTVEQLAWFSCIRGSYYMYFRLHKQLENIPGKKKQKEITKPDLKIWDPLNTVAVVGANGIKYAIHRRWATKEAAMDEYDLSEKDLGTAETIGQEKEKDVPIYIYVDDSWEKVIIGNKFVMESEHELGYCPVISVKAGAMPEIQDENYDTAYINRGESIFKNIRLTHDVKNRIMSYYLTNVGLAVKQPIFLTYDSSKGGLPVEIDDTIWKKGKQIPIDIGKGQSIQEIAKSVPTVDINAFLSVITRQESIGGLTPVVYGYTDASMPVGTTNMLINGSREFLNSFVQSVRLGLDWICKEFIQQFKMGGFPKIHFSGTGNSKKVFNIDVRPKDISDKWEVKCTVTPSLPQDILTNTQIAKTWVDSQLTSTQTAREILPIQNPDQEQRNINKEQALNAPIIKYHEMIVSLIRDGQPELAKELLDYFEAQQAQAQQGNNAYNQAKGQQSPGYVNTQIGSSQNAIMNSGNPQVPDEVRNAFRNMNRGQ